MPNWCATTIYITHEDKNVLRKLKDLICEWSSKNYMSNGFGNNWLGNIVIGSGVGTVDENADTDLRCRGTLEEVCIEGDKLYIYTETAWSPFVKMWKLIADKYIPGANIKFIADEPGCDVSYSNDMDVANHYDIKYDVEAYDNGLYVPRTEYMYELSEREFVETIQELLNTDEDAPKLLMKMAMESDRNFYIRKWEYVSLDEVCGWG